MGSLTVVDIERIYAGAFLAYVSFVEVSIERLFLGLLMNRFVSGQSQVAALATINSDRV
ncbi:MAG: hypothetical protein IH961_10405, partial [Chloroflexi bacterium]|nr:hypothetical protein [Chloroflexota bacterium]